MGATTFYMLEKEREERAKRASETDNAEGHEAETEQATSDQEQGSAQAEPEGTESVDLSDHTVDELKDMAKDAEIDAYYDMKKAELIEALEGENGGGA